MGNVRRSPGKRAPEEQTFTFAVAIELSRELEEGEGCVC